MMIRTMVGLAVAPVLSACGAEPTWAPDQAVRAARFVSEEPPSVTLCAVVDVGSGQGAPTGLLVNGPDRVMFDPAGTRHHPRLPERNDVHHCMSDRMMLVYIDYHAINHHARETFYVIEQKLPVSSGTAELVMARAKAYGAVRAVNDVHPPRRSGI